MEEEPKETKQISNIKEHRKTMFAVENEKLEKLK